MFDSKVILPAENLRPYVSHYWVMRSEGISMEMNIIPTGIMKWMFHRKLPFMINGKIDLGTKASIGGHHGNLSHVRATCSMDSIFVFFKPYAMSLITGMPCGVFAYDNVDMDCLESDDFKMLKRQVLAADTSEEAIVLIEAFINLQLTRRSELVHTKRMIKVCQTIELNPAVSINQLADISCLSERQFRRVFTDYIGMPPKHLLRLRRLFFASKFIQAQTISDFTHIIHRLGFTDHSHFNKEFKAFSGMTPSEYALHVEAIKQQQIFKAYRDYHE